LRPPCAPLSKTSSTSRPLAASVTCGSLKMRMATGDGKREHFAFALAVKGGFAEVESVASGRSFVGEWVLVGMHGLRR